MSSYLILECFRANQMLLIEQPRRFEYAGHSQQYLMHTLSLQVSLWFTYRLVPAINI